MSLPGRLANRLKQVTLGVTKNWAKQRKAEERHASAEANRRARLTRVRDDYWNFRSASFHVMERAYLAASANGTLPASARQVMYQARPLVQQMVDRPLDDQYFCQTLLPDYIEESGVDWDITYDDRGHFLEPHTKCTIGLGTISVRNYLARLTEPNLTDPDFAPRFAMMEALEAAIDKSRHAIKTERMLFRGARALRSVEGANVVIVDAHLTSPWKVLAAADAVQKVGAARVGIAAPVSTQQVQQRVRARRFDFVCPSVVFEAAGHPHPFGDPQDPSAERLRSIIVARQAA